MEVLLVAAKRKMADPLVQSLIEAVIVVPATLCGLAFIMPGFWQ